MNQDLVQGVTNAVGEVRIWLDAYVPMQKCRYAIWGSVSRGFLGFALLSGQPQLSFVAAAFFHARDYLFHSKFEIFRTGKQAYDEMAVRREIVEMSGMDQYVLLAKQFERPIFVSASGGKF